MFRVILGVSLVSMSVFADIGFVSKQRGDYAAPARVAYLQGETVHFRRCLEPVTLPLTRFCETEQAEVQKTLTDYLNGIPTSTLTYERNAAGLEKAKKDLAEAEATNNQDLAYKLLTVVDNLSRIVDATLALEEKKTKTIYEETDIYSFWRLTRPLGFTIELPQMSATYLGRKSHYAAMKECTELGGTLPQWSGKNKELADLFREAKAALYGLQSAHYLVQANVSLSNIPHSTEGYFAGYEMGLETSEQAELIQMLENAQAKLDAAKNKVVAAEEALQSNADILMIRAFRDYISNLAMIHTTAQTLISDDGKTVYPRVAYFVSHTDPERIEISVQEFAKKDYHDYNHGICLFNN